MKTVKERKIHCRTFFFVAEQEFLFCYSFFGCSVIRKQRSRPLAQPAVTCTMLPQNKNYVKTLPVLNSLLQQHFCSATVFPFRNSISINTVKIVRSATVVTISVLEWGFPNNTVRLQFFFVLQQHTVAECTRATVLHHVFGCDRSAQLDNPPWENAQLCPP